MKKLLSTLFNHERYQSIAVIVIILLLIWSYGCPSRVKSLNTPGKQVTRAELQIEIDTLLATAEAHLVDLNRQDSIKRLIYENLLLTAQSGQFNLIGLVAGAAGVLGIGATVDNVRKRREIKDLKNT